MRFEARVQEVSADRLQIELDRTAFYPTSGGQPHDLGLLAGIPIKDVFEAGERIVHVLAEPLPEGATSVEGVIDAERRLDHMRQHTGQHLLSAVMEEQFGLKTVSFHLGADYATVDVEPHPTDLALIELAANRRLLENLAIGVSYEDAATAQGLRKQPDRDGVLRIVTITGLDRSACGGTHVRGTAEVGMIVLGKTEKVRKALRIEFYCGERAVRFLRGRAADAEQQLTQVRERLADADKRARKLGVELATMEGRNHVVEADAHGRKVWVAECEDLGDETKARLNAFTAQEGTLAVFHVRGGTSILIGAHPSLGYDCGARLRAVVSKGGGSPKSAQGSVGDPAQLQLAIDQLIEP